MNGLQLIFVVVLVGLTYAQYDGPYASVMTWYSSGCNATTYNYPYSLYLCPADGSCFSPSGNNGKLNTTHGYKITYNQITVQVFGFENEDCSGTAYAPYYYPIDACSGDAVVSIYQTLPPNQYWVDLGIVGYGDEKWETILITSYYSSLGCNSLSDIEIQGWPECSVGSKFYCQNSELNWEFCVNVTACVDCIQAYAPLSSNYTATPDAPSGWYYVNTGYASSYQATCAGTIPSPSVTPSK